MAGQNFPGQRPPGWEPPAGTVQRKGGVGKAVLIGVGVLIGLGVLGQMAGQDKQAKPEAAAAGEGPAAGAVQPAVAEVNAPEITKAEFAALRDGMSRAQAGGIVGSPGEVISESAMAGVRTVMVQWEGDSFGGNANAMFQNDRLISKAQFGLD